LIKNKERNIAQVSQHTLKVSIGEKREALLAAWSQQGGGGEVEGELQAHVRRRKHRGGGGGGKNRNMDRNRERNISVGDRSRCSAQKRSTDNNEKVLHHLKDQSRSSVEISLSSEHNKHQEGKKWLCKTI
jgi:hypothetical protein